jgi:hypothetical protein
MLASDGKPAMQAMRATMTDDSNEDKLRLELLAAARRQLGWRRLMVLRNGSTWLVEQAGGKGDGARWTAEPRQDGSGWWFLKEER